MRQDRSPESEAHWDAVNWAYRIFGLGFVIGGAALNQTGEDGGMGWALVGIGVWMMLPSTRPLISSIVDRIPGLPKR